MPLQATSGAASYDAFGGGVAAVPTYIEDVFSTWLYTGNGSTQTINNGIDLAGKGGLVWIKKRSEADNNFLFDTNRGATFRLISNATNASSDAGDSLVAFNSNGFNLDGGYTCNGSGNTLVSWTLRRQPKFFDVVTYTGNGSAQNISHSLGSVPGCVIVKNLNTAQNWQVYHKDVGNTQALQLNGTAAASAPNAIFWNNTTPTSTQFTVGTANSSSGDPYIAYVFAHNAGGFGLSGTDNVISCGSYTAAASAVTVDLGYEPQWVMVKSATNAANWLIIDTMRGAPNTTAGSGWANLYPNTSGAEQNFFSMITPTATGFIVDQNVNQSAFVNGSGTYIYIAIRRGPMKVPTTGTSVFSPVAATTGTQTTGFPIDMMMQFWRTSNDIYANTEVVDRLRGVSSNSTARSTYLLTTSTGAEDSLGSINASLNWTNTGFDVPPAYSGGSNGFECFRRAPGFFDEVCYTGTGTDDRQVTHNLGVAPELIICKSRNAAWPWWVGGSVLGSTRNGMYLNETSARQTNADAFSTNGAAFTSSYFLVSSVSAYPPNATGYTQVAYLFATCPGVSKVFNYTGNGSSQTINCGFTGGARFVMIKRTDSTGDWYVWDSARGIVSGNDPRLSLNTTAAEVTTDDSVDTDSTGFVVNQLSATNINVSSATYIGIAIA